MSENMNSSTASAVKTSKLPVSGPKGKIVYCKNLNAWRCVDARGRQVLMTGSKEAAINKYPSFTVIDKE